MDIEMEDMDTSPYINPPSAPINIPNSQNAARYEDGSDVEDNRTEQTRQILLERYSCGGSTGDMVHDSPKLPRPSNDFNNVMLKFHTNIMTASCPTYGNRLLSPMLASHGSDPTLEILPLSSALSPASGRRRPPRNVHFDEATITVTAEMGESAARFRSRWRQRHALSSSPPIKFGSKNIVIRHEEQIDGQDIVKSSTGSDSKLSNCGKSIFDVCNYSQYGRYA